MSFAAAGPLDHNKPASKRRTKAGAHRAIGDTPAHPIGVFEGRGNHREHRFLFSFGGGEATLTERRLPGHSLCIRKIKNISTSEVTTWRADRDWLRPAAVEERGRGNVRDHSRAVEVQIRLLKQEVSVCK